MEFMSPSFQVSPSHRAHRCGDQVTMRQLIQTLHLQIRKPRPKFAKVTVLALCLSLHGICKGIKERGGGREKGREEGRRKVRSANH